MDREEIRYLLGSTIYARAKAYENRVQDLECETAENGVRHLSADVRGSGRNLYRTQAWLRQNGSFVSASCTCPFNENGEGPCCKHIGALLLHEVDEPEEKREPKPEKKALLDIPGVQRGTEFAKEAAARKDSYVSGLEMLFGRKWRGDEPVSDVQAQELLRAYQEDALAEVESLTASDGQQRGFAELEPELILDYSGQPPLLRLRISDGGRQYVVKSIPELLTAIEKERSVSYGKTLAFVHRWDAFTSEAQKILTLLRRQQDTVKSVEAATGRPTRSIANGPAGSVPLSGELLDELVVLYEPRGEVGGYALRKGLPALTLRVEKKRGGVHIVVEPSLYTLQGLDYSYLYNEDTIWKLERAEAARLLPALNALCGSGLFFTSKDAVSFCSFVLPELGRKITIDDPDRLLLNQIPLEPVVQFYLDAPHMGAVRAHPEFLYGEDRVTPFAAPTDLLRDARAERRAGRLLQTYLTQQTDTSPAEYGTDDEDTLVTFLEEGVPALLAEGEVYLSDAFRDLQAAPPKISVGVSVQGSVLDLEVDTGEFPVSELKALLKSLHQKKRYHRLRDGRLLRLDDSLEVLDELNETLELSGAKLGQNHAQLPLYRAPSLDWALSGQTGVRFNRDDAFRRISRSFHAVKDSEYAPPVSLQKTLRKYQRDGYRWLRTLDGYGMGGILADDMGLGKTVQVLSYLLAMKEKSLARCCKLLYALLQEEQARWMVRATRKTDQIFSGFVRGKMLDSLIIGILCFIGCSIFSLPYTPLVSVVVGVTNMIPFFGPFLGAAPSAFLILLVSPKQCLIFIVFIIVLQQIDGNIIGPKILGDATGISSFWVVVAITVGGGFAGVLGMFLGVPIFACLQTLVKYLTDRRLEKRHMPLEACEYVHRDQEPMPPEEPPAPPTETN